MNSIRTIARCAPFVGGLVLAIPFAQGCSQPVPNCQATAAVAYAAKYKQTAGDDTCSVSGLPGDTIGLQSFNPATKNAQGLVVPNLNKVDLAIRTHFLGAQVAYAFDNGVVDETDGHAPHAFGPFDSAQPVDEICTATLAPAQQTLGEVAEDLGDPEDPDDDLPAQPALDVKEEWSDVQLLNSAANLGTQMKGHLKVTDVAAGCEAEYDVLAIYPAVFCNDTVPDGDPVDIASIDDDDGVVHVVTAAPHGLAVGDAIEIADADDELSSKSFAGTYSVAEVISDTELKTAEIDPFDGEEPDGPLADTGTVVKLKDVANDDYCVSEAQPEKGFAVGSGISQDYDTVCDPDLFLCVLKAEPGSDGFPFLKK
jgi:hypothetical protein